MHRRKSCVKHTTSPVLPTSVAVVMADAKLRRECRNYLRSTVRLRGLRSLCEGLSTKSVRKRIGCYVVECTCIRADPPEDVIARHMPRRGKRHHSNVAYAFISCTTEEVCWQKYHDSLQSNSHTTIGRPPQSHLCSLPACVPCQHSTTPSISIAGSCTR